MRRYRKKIQNERKNYNIGYLSLNLFIGKFHQYTNFILKKAASMHGNFFALSEESRSEVISMLNNKLKETYMSKILFELGENLNMLSLNFPTWQNDDEFNQLIGTIEKYYKQFDIYIIEVPEGLYYEIPAKL